MKVISGRRPDPGPVGWTVKHGASLILPDTGEDRHVKALSGLLGLKIRSLLVVPLQVIRQNRLRTIGALEAVDTAGQRFHHVERILLESAAAAVAMGLEKVRLAELNTVLRQEADHRVLNNLAAIIGLIELEKRWEAVEKLPGRPLLQSLTGRVYGLAAAYRMLSSREWPAALLLTELVDQVIDSTVEAISPSTPVRVDIQPNLDVRVPSHQVNSLALVVNELVANSLKHALAPDKKMPLRITIRVTRQNDQLVLRYADNGPGYPEETVGQTGFKAGGLGLVQHLVQRALAGTLTCDNDGGAVNVIRFPAV